MALFEFSVREDDLDESYRIIRETLSETVAFPGSLGVDVWIQDDDRTRVSVLEHWASIEDDQAYRAWRAGDGAPKEFIRVLASRPTLRYFRRAEAFADLTPPAARA
jgi:heme oxygenase (mycobilin-producing)